jgi:hypothetical protein
MRERRFGRIVFVSTDLVGQPMPGAAGYVAATAGLEDAQLSTIRRRSSTRRPRDAPGARRHVMSVLR